jgi:putative redox protein
MKKRITLAWIKKNQLVAEDEFGHSLVLDSDKESGGDDSGFRPLDLLLIALAGCMAMDIVAIVTKKRGKISSYRMVLEGELTEDHPKRFTKISYVISARGDYRDDDFQRAFELSRDKYCSVLHTLKTPPEFEFKIARDGA